MSLAASSNRANLQPPESIESIVRAEFRRSSYRGLTLVSPRYREGVLSLFGCVPTYHLKQMALTLIRRKFARIRIDDRVEVSPKHAQSVGKPGGYQPRPMPRQKSK